MAAKGRKALQRTRAVRVEIWSVGVRLSGFGAKFPVLSWIIRLCITTKITPDSDGFRAACPDPAAVPGTYCVSGPDRPPANIHTADAVCQDIAWWAVILLLLINRWAVILLLLINRWAI